MPRKPRFLWVMGLAVLAVLAGCGVVSAAAVQPLVFQLDVSPGESVPFAVNVSAQDAQEIFHVSIYGVAQEADGNLKYLAEGGAPARDWVTLDAVSVVVPPTENRDITGVVKVPFDAEGTYVLALMVEPESTYTAGQVTFQFRYAVRMVINVVRPGLRPTIAVEGIDLQKDEDGNSLIRAVVQNTSRLLFPLSAEVTIRDENRALVERVPLRPAGLQDPTHTAPINIYPEAELWLDGQVTKPLFPGTYDVRLFVNYSDGLQKTHAQTLTVEGMEYAAQAAQYLTVDPAAISTQVIPGGSQSTMLAIANNTAEKLMVEIAAVEVVPGYPYSIFENVNVELRTPSLITIEPRRPARAVLVVRPPRDIQPGGYYGSLLLTAADEAGNMVSQQLVPLAAVVGEGSEPSAVIQSTAITPVTEGKWMLSMVVRNTGSIHIAPVGTAYLQNAAGEIVRTLRCELQEGTSVILPEMDGSLVSPDFSVEPGEYRVEVHVYVGSQELAVREETISIVQEEEN